MSEDVMHGAPALDGDRATYEQCKDPDCPAHREGYNHAHLVSVERAEEAETS
jgi:hypothetical protein